jgi:subtilisin family serine protease
VRLHSPEMPWPTGTIRIDEVRPRRGQGVRVAVVDSGVYALHPHVGGVTDGVGVTSDGALDDDCLDRLGHGTAVTAAIREKAPAADIVVARVFDRRLETTVAALAAAIRWAVAERAHLINLSLGTATADHEAALREVVDEATRAGAWVVAAAEQGGVRWLPGAIPGVIAVSLDWALPREACVLEIGAHGVPAMRASGYPRPIPGVPPERNMKGISFAVANATGLLASLLEELPLVPRRLPR